MFSAAICICRCSCVRRRHPFFKLKDPLAFVFVDELPRMSPAACCYCVIGSRNSFGLIPVDLRAPLFDRSTDARLSSEVRIVCVVFIMRVLQRLVSSTQKTSRGGGLDLFPVLQLAPLKSLIRGNGLSGTKWYRHPLYTRVWFAQKHFLSLVFVSMRERWGPAVRKVKNAFSSTLFSVNFS